MRFPCKNVTLLLGSGDLLSSSAEEHLLSCPACSGTQAGFSRLDELLFSEPVPAAPPELLSTILLKIQSIQRAELVWFRTRAVLISLAAAILVAIGYSLPQFSPEPLAPEYATALSTWQTSFANFSEQFIQNWTPSLELFPAEVPWLALIICFPCLLACHWVFSKRALRAAS